MTEFTSTLLLRSQLSSIPPVEPLIDGVLSLRSAAVLFGPTGAGKTFVSISMVCSVGTGLPWLGRPVRRHPAMYVVGEGGPGLDRRVAAWEAAQQQKVGDDEVIFSVRPSDFADGDVWRQLATEAKALQVRLVVLDTFSSLAPSADETKDAATFTRRLSDLAATIDGTAMVVHHPGWSDATRARGGYQLEANVDEVLMLAGGPMSNSMTLTRKKVKEGQAGATMRLRKRSVPLGLDEKGEPFGSVVIEAETCAETAAPVRNRTRAEAPAPTRARILAALSDVGDVGAAGPELLKATGTDEKRGTLYKALRALVDEGLVVKNGNRGAERYTLAKVATGA